MMNTGRRVQYMMANWKMNGTQASVQDLLDHLKLLQVYKNQQIVIFPSFLHLEKTAQILKNSPIDWGAQNVSSYASGAYTGEISAAMLKDNQCKYALIGHSERRQYFHETEESIAQKILACLKTGLRPVLCVGETLEDYQRKQTQQKIFMQLQSMLEFLKSGEIHSAALLPVIAYEPVWAIGTGLNASPDYAQEAHQFIRHTVSCIDKDLGERIPIIYGGSVNASNAKSLFSMPDIDGGLIGRASLNAEEFQLICQANQENNRKITGA